MSNPYETGILLAGNTGYNKNGKPLWPKARQQKEYTQQSAAADTQATLGNISFALFPFMPFSYRWTLAERGSADSTVFRPEWNFSKSYAQRLLVFKNVLKSVVSDAQPRTSRRSATDEFASREAMMTEDERSHVEAQTQTFMSVGSDQTADQIMEDAYKSSFSKKKIKQATDEVAQLFYEPFKEAEQESIFLPDIGYIGEIASETMAFEDELNKIMIESGDEEWTEGYWPHLYDSGIGPKGANAFKVSKATGIGTYLDKAPYDKLSRRNLELTLSYMEKLGVKKDILQNVIGGEETIDSGKLMLKEFKRLYREDAKIALSSSNSPAEVIEELTRIAKQMSIKLQDDFNAVLRGSTQKIIKNFGLTVTDLEKLSTAQPASSVREWKNTHASNWTGSTSLSLGEDTMANLLSGDNLLGKKMTYWAFPDQKAIDQGAIAEWKRRGIKATTGLSRMRPYAEVKQLVSRLKNIFLQNIASNSTGHTYFYQIPLVEGFTGLFFMEFNTEGVTDWNALKNKQIFLKVTPQVLWTPMQAYGATGLEVLQHAAIMASNITHLSGMEDFKQRRNELTKSWAMAYGLSSADFDIKSKATLDAVTRAAAGNPLMTMRGYGVSSVLTPAAFNNIVKQDLRRMINGNPTLVKGIKDAFDRAILKSNEVTAVWKEAVVSKVQDEMKTLHSQGQGDFDRTYMYTPEAFDYTSNKINAGIWKKGIHGAMEGFAGEGPASAPVFGFTSATDAQAKEIDATMAASNASWVKLKGIRRV